MRTQPTQTIYTTAEFVLRPLGKLQKVDFQQSFIFFNHLNLSIKVLFKLDFMSIVHITNLYRFRAQSVTVDLCIKANFKNLHENRRC